MFRDSFWGQHGFEELRKFIKQGNEFNKDVAVIMQERADLETSYAKGLQKLSAKLTKAASGCLGTLAAAWGLVATEMESQGELHKILGHSLLEDIHKPLKSLYDTQHKNRKPIETMVDKAARLLQDKRSDENKCKRLAFNNAKEREKVMEQHTISVKNNKEKEIARLDKSVKKCEDSTRKADKEYHDACHKAETARLDWEYAVAKGNGQLQTLEEERINQMRDFLNKYNSHMSVIGPKLVKSCDKIGEAVLSINLTADVRTVIDQKGTGPNQPEQLLPDYFAEDMSNYIEKERRRQCLQTYLIYLQQDIEREHKAKDGVQKLVEVYENRPSFADAEAQEDAKTKLLNANVFLNFFEAAHFKISSVVASLEGRPKPTSKFSDYIEHTKDKMGLPASILRLPLHMLVQTPDVVDSSATHRLPADGGQEAVYQSGGPRAMRTIDLKKRKSTVSGIYGDDGEFDEYPDHNRIVGQCRAVYEYSATQSDELSIKPDDVISIYEKQEDGWWLGELNGKVGIFPATYVEETSSDI